METAAGPPPVTLTKEQQVAVNHVDGPMLILAGPGSGKTEVMTRRVARLIRNAGIEPDRILCITFTNKAADQLRDKIRDLVDADIDVMQISTIHSFCHTLLERYVERLPVNRSFRVLDENSQFLYVYNRRYPLKLTFPKSRKGKFLRDVIRLFNQCTEETVDPEALMAAYREQAARCDQAEQLPYYEELEGVAESYQRYCDYLLRDSVLDYGHLQKLAYRLLQEHPDILAEVRDQYQYIQVDEFQDTNPIQAELFRLIAGDRANITVVGDDDQSIYRFRGATVENIYQFQEWYPETRVVKLQTNFRSTERIVEFTSRFIANLGDRFEKQLTTGNEQGNPVLHVHGETVADQADRTADLLVRLKEQGCVEYWGDVALLLRSVSYHGEEYLNAFRDREIPFVVEGDRSLFQREDVNDFRNLLLFLGDKKVALSSLARPALDLDETTREILTGSDLKISGEDLPESHLPEIETAADRSKILALLELRKTVQKKTYDDVTAVYFALMEISGYFERALKRNDEPALQNLGLFSSIIFQFDEIASRTTVGQFEWYLRWLGKDTLDQATPPVEDAVQIMTVHQAKGLEFPVVIVGSLLENRFPVSFKSSYYQVPEELRTFQTALDQETHFNDERRLFYVACTRAEKLLILSSADKVNKRGKASRFLGGCPAELSQTVDPEMPPLSRFPVNHRPVGERTYLSYSHIMYYLYCPLHYKFFAEYDFHVPQVVRVSYGESLHLALAELHQKVQNRTVPEEELADIYERNWISMGYRARRFEESLKTQGLELFREYYRTNRDQLESISGVEWPFTYTVDPVVLQGRIDLMKERNGGMEIIDFKTGGILGTYGVPPALQLGIYALAVEGNLAKPVSALTFYSLRENRGISFPWDDQLRPETVHHVPVATTGIGKRDFEPTPGKHCRECEFRTVCIHAGS